MTFRRALLVLCLVFLPVSAFAVVGADVGITASDSPDPVAPDGNITYTIHVTNAGPSTATTAHLNVILNGTLLWQSMTVPAGWTCPALSVGHGGSFTCTAATLASGSNDVFTIVLNAGKNQFGILDQTINQLFTVNATESDPNSANNSVTVSTFYAGPHADMQISAADSPDPVAPDGNITYTVNVTNAGPDTTANAHMSVVLNGTLLWQSMVVPAGWTCPALAVGHGASFTCTAATFAPSTSTFTIVLKAGVAQFGINNQTINETFTTSSDWFDPNNANNAVAVSTQYVTPHADMQITASDSPDPVNPDGNITYTVTVTNAGPDATTNAHMSVILNNTLLWQSMTVPAGWTCPSLAVGHGASFTCTAANLATPGTSVFTIVLKAGLAQFGNTNQTINETFTTSSDSADSNNANNAVAVSTSYVVPTANLAVTNSDAPDPVNSGSTITYTQTLTNNGPDAAANAKITETIGSGVTFQSVSIAGGFSCTTIPPGGTGTLTCSIPSLANGATASFTVKVNVTAASGTITNTVAGSSDASDPTPANNAATATTTVIAPPTADLGITKSTPTTNAAPGAPVTYTIVVTNHGPDAATSVTMTDVLPATLKFQSLNSPAGFSCTLPAVGATGTINCTAASLVNGATATFTLVVTSASNASGAIGNTASVSGTPTDPSSGNNGATASFTAGSADLALGGGVSANGPTITYTFTLTNGGPDGASNPVFTDNLPSSLFFQSITPPPGWNCTTPPIGTTGTITCTAPSFASGATGTFTIVTTAAPGATGTINNGAGISSSTSDPNSGNSTSAPVVTAPVSTNVPALSTWALMLLAAILGLGALMKMR